MEIGGGQFGKTEGQGTSQAASEEIHKAIGHMWSVRFNYFFVLVIPSLLITGVILFHEPILSCPSLLLLC